MKVIVLLGLGFVISLCHIGSVNGQHVNILIASANDRSFTTEVEDLREIPLEEIPLALRTTLADAQYKDWESGLMYFNSDNGEYLLKTLVPVHENTPIANLRFEPLWYRFDKEGKPISEKPKK